MGEAEQASCPGGGQVRPHPAAGFLPPCCQGRGPRCSSWPRPRVLGPEAQRVSVWVLTAGSRTGIWGGPCVRCPTAPPLCHRPLPTGQVTREPSGCTPTSCPQSPGQEPHPSPKMPPGCRSRQSWEGGGARLLLRPSLSLTPPSSSPELRHARFNMAPLCWREAAVLGGMAVCPHGPRGSQSPAFRACPQPGPGDPTFRAAWGLPHLQLSVGPRPLPRPVTGLTHLGPRPPRQLPARPLA